MEAITKLLKNKTCQQKDVIARIALYVASGQRITRSFLVDNMGFDKREAHNWYLFYHRNIKPIIGSNEAASQSKEQNQQPMIPKEKLVEQKDSLGEVVSMDSNGVAAATKDVQQKVQLKAMESADDSHEVLGIFNEMTGRNQRPTIANLKHIRARLKEGYTLSEIKAVIACKVQEWQDSEKMSRYLRISTIFSAKNFDNYLQDAALYVKKYEYAERYAEDAKSVIAYFNSLLVSPEEGYDINNKVYHEKIGWWLGNGRTVDDLKRVAYVMAHNWSGTYNLHKLNPNEIFGKNFKVYESEEEQHAAVGTKGTNSVRDLRQSKKDVGTLIAAQEDSGEGYEESAVDRYNRMFGLTD